MASLASTTPVASPSARAESSCVRCHRRKKRCDKTLPECEACKNANVSCSFRDDERQVASFPISYVRALENRVAELEQQLILGLPAPNSAGDPLSLPWDPTLQFPSSGMTPLPQEHVSAIANDDQFSPPTGSADSLGEETKLLSLEATAERHLGSSSGVSFAKLTQAVLRRLSPGQEAFTFERDTVQDFQPEQMTSHDFLLSPSNMFTPFGPNVAFASPAPLNPDLQVTSQLETDFQLTSLDDSHIQHLLEFYFAHSHTLYPFIRQDDIQTVLWRIYSNPLDPLAKSPLWQFRIWMVLAIGSTAYCSISLAEETESVVFFNRAMSYFERVLGCGDMAAVEALMLQVSYSFFNQTGPNTWFLVGIAVRIAIGMGLHAASTYSNLPVDVAEHNKRIFWSLYMMDRMVSMASGRPFAMSDADIDVAPFADADDDQIKPDGIIPRSTLQPSNMAVPLHILALRKIASDIGNQVHSSGNSRPDQNSANSEEILQHLHKRLIEWRRSMPFPLPNIQSKVPQFSTNWFDLNYYMHVLTLYRPSPLCPTLNIPKIGILAEASAMAIRQAISMHRQQRFAYNWLNLFAVFTSTVSLMYATTVHPDSLSMVLERTKALDDLELATELLDAFGKKFTAAKKIRAMVEEVMTRLRAHAIQ